MTVIIRNEVLKIPISVTTIILMMRAATLVLLVFISLAAFAFCEESKVADNEPEGVFDTDNLSEGDPDNLSKNENDPFFGWGRRRRYVRRRRSSWRRRRSYLRRRRSSWRRRRSYLRRRRSSLRRRRSYLRRRSSVRRRIRPNVSASRRRTSTWSSGRSRYDKCGRLCKVVNGRLTNCCRVRKEFESMTERERERYVRAFHRISTKEPFKKDYDKLIKMHERYFSSRIHRKEEFLPWHRWFNLQIENLLHKVDCRVTLPYWDWSLWSHAPWSRKVWNSKVGLGGNGSKSDHTVRSGLFRCGAWKTATGECLKREFRGAPPDAVQVAITLKEPTFKWFELMLRVNLHEGMHCFIAGTMCSRKSAEAPEFFLHHGFIDKIWADYQSKSRLKKFVFFSTINARMQGIPYKPRRLLDNNNLPGGVRVCYKNPTVNQARKIRVYLNNKTFKQLERLRRLAFPDTPEKAKTMFKLTPQERSLALRLEREAKQGVYSGKKSVKVAKRLTPLEKIEGFKIPKSRVYGDDEE